MSQTSLSSGAEDDKRAAVVDLLVQVSEEGQWSIHSTTTETTEKRILEFGDPSVPVKGQSTQSVFRSQPYSYRDDNYSNYPTVCKEGLKCRFLKLKLEKPWSELHDEFMPQLETLQQSLKTRLSTHGGLFADWTDSSPLKHPSVCLSTPLSSEGPCITLYLILVDDSSKSDRSSRSSASSRLYRASSNPRRRGRSRSRDSYYEVDGTQSGSGSNNDEADCQDAAKEEEGEGEKEKKANDQPYLWGLLCTDDDEVYDLQPFIALIPQCLREAFPRGRLPRSRARSYYYPQRNYDSSYDGIRSISHVMASHLAYELLFKYTVNLQTRIETTIINLSTVEKQLARPNADLSSLRHSLNTCQLHWRKLENYNYKFARYALKEAKSNLLSDYIEVSPDRIDELLKIWKEESLRFEDDIEAVQRTLTDAVSERQQDLSNELSRTSLELTKASLKLAQAAQKDSRSMRAIAYATLTFLPGTFVASFFSMCFFNAPGANGSIFDSAYRHMWIYFAIAIPTTLLVLLGFQAWERAEFAKELDGLAVEGQVGVVPISRHREVIREKSGRQKSKPRYEERRREVRSAVARSASTLNSRDSYLA